MRSDFLDTYTRLASRISRKSKAVLCNMFCSLFHDESSPSSAAEAAIYERVAMCMLDMDDPDIILDTRSSMASLVQVVLMSFGMN